MSRYSHRSRPAASQRKGSKNEIIPALFLVGGMIVLAGGAYAFSDVVHKAVETKPQEAIHASADAGGADPAVELQIQKDLEKPHIKIDTKEENNARYELSIDFPQLIGGDQANTDACNKALGKMARAIDTSFRDSLREEDSEDMPDTSDPLNAMKSSVEARFVPVLVSSTRITGYFTISRYSRGAAHPSESTEVFNYDLNTSHEISLDDIVVGAKKLTSLAKVLRPRIESAVKDRGGDSSDLTQGGLAPEKKNFQHFVISDTSVSWFFDPYVLAPYALGSFQIEVPFSDLKGTLTEAYRAPQAQK